MVDREEIKRNVIAWVQDAEASVIEGADDNGWSVSSRSLAKNSLSRYLTFRRGTISVKVRISDHQSVYGTENYSLSPDAYDDSLEDVLIRLEATDDPE